MDRCGSEDDEYVTAGIAANSRVFVKLEASVCVCSDKCVLSCFYVCLFVIAVGCVSSPAAHAHVYDLLFKGCETRASKFVCATSNDLASIHTLAYVREHSSYYAKTK